MTLLQAVRKQDLFQGLMGFGAVLVLGFGTAAAAIKVGPQADANPAMRPLTIGISTRLEPAFGPDDEDCVWAIHRARQPDGTVKSSRELSCDQ